MLEWYYTEIGIQQGPVSEDEIRQKIRRGEIGDSSLLWRDGMAEWLPFSQIPELQNGAVVGSLAGAQEMEGLAQLTSESASPSSIPLPQTPSFPGYHGESNIPSFLWQSLVALVVSCIGMIAVSRSNWAVDFCDLWIEDFVMA